MSLPLLRQVFRTIAIVVADFVIVLAVLVIGLLLDAGGWGGRALLALYPHNGVVVEITSNIRPSDEQ